MTTVGWAGLGAIGLPMALRMAAAHELVVSHHSEGPAETAIAAAGARIAPTPRATAAAADVMISMVRDQPQTDQVVNGPDGALAGLRAGSALVIMSTLSADYCRQLAERGRALRVDVVDAPVSGGTPAAERGELTIMVGGAEPTVDCIRPVLDVLGTEVIRLGPVGAGQLAKIVNNTIKIAVLAATTEQLDLAVNAGLDLDAVLRVLRASSANSHVLEHWDYYYRFKREHRPAGPLDILSKDLALDLDLARRLGIDVPVATALAGLDVGRLVGPADPAKETA